jgi:hypothetical protein
MLYEQFQKAIRAESAFRPDPSLVISRWKGICTVDGLYPLPVICASASMPRSAIIDVQDQHKQPLGMLVTCKGSEFEIGKFGAAHLAAYLFEVSPDQYSQPGRFSTDYLLVKKERLKEYKDTFMNSSSIWGGFWHEEQNLPSTPATSVPSPIVACLGIKLPTPLHVAAARRSAIVPYAFERYLKLYHLLELSFDHDTVMRIQSLGDDLHGIGKILAQHKKEEHERLKQLIIEKCSDPAAVAVCLEQICGERKWDATTDSIFFDFGKDHNPFANKQAQFRQMITGIGFTEQGAADSGLLSQGEIAQGAFQTLVLKTAAYWIYRVRCSIAHNRIGEYVMKPEDEEFVEQFAERLLRQVLATVLR